jgi:predicted Zn-dependent protease
VEERYDTLMLKAQILDALNRGPEGAPLKKHAMEIANPIQIYMYGRQFQLVQKKNDQAIEIFKQTAQRYPNHWLGHMAQARVYSAAGDYRKAAVEMKAASVDAPDQQKPGIAGYIKRLEAGEDINK